MEPTTNDLNMNLFDRALDRLCLTPIGLAGLILLLMLPFIPPFNQEYMLRWLIYCGFVAAMSVGFDLTAGYINIVNFGYMAVAGTGGYTSALLVINAGFRCGCGVFLRRACPGFSAWPSWGWPPRWSGSPEGLWGSEPRACSRRNPTSRFIF
jgi:branched-chain amino acid transport system permease protein